MRPKRRIQTLWIGLAVVPSLLCLMATLHDDSGAAVGRSESTATVHSAGRGYPWINFREVRSLATPLDDPEWGRAALSTGSIRPLSLASEDFDEDGIPDLICGVTGTGGNKIILYRGNADAIYPDTPEARRRKADGTFSGAPFLSHPEVFATPEAPELLGAGDFDGDGHRDVVAAARGGKVLHFLPGDGHGILGEAELVPLPGRITAFVTGEVNRPDGLADIVLGIEEESGARVLVFESAGGAIKQDPSVFAMPGEPTAITLGRVAGDARSDIFVAAGFDLMVIRRDEGKRSPDQSQAAEVAQAVVTRRSFPFFITSLAIGDFSGDHRLELALLGRDGRVYLSEMDTSTATLADPWYFPSTDEQALKEVFEISSVPGAVRSTVGTSLLRLKASSSPKDDLLAVDPVGRRLHVLMGETPGVGKGTMKSASLPVESAPVAALAMRLNRDALSDLVVLQSGLPEPFVLLTTPVNRFTVTNTNDSGPGSLRQAIRDANASPGADAIDFEYSGNGFIILTSELDRITEAVTIDGLTHLEGTVGLTPNNLDVDGLILGGGNIVVRGIRTILFGRNDIYVASNGNIIEGNSLGINSGIPGITKGRAGVRIGGASNNTVGGTAAAARNTISGRSYGVVIVGTTATGNTVQGNFIGTREDGLTVGNVGHVNDGVLISNAPNNVVGGTSGGAGNLISGNGKVGVRITGGFASGNLVQGNQIGTNVTGAAALGNVLNGVLIDAASGNTLGGTVIGARNVISGNGAAGVTVSGNAATGNRIQGNYIGTTATGNAALGNVLDGVQLTSVSGNLVGGRAGGARNVISGNGATGILIDGAVGTGNVVQGNYIGSNSAGTAALGNSAEGILIREAPFNIVGGARAGAGNVISGNGGYGLGITATAGSGNAEGNQVQGNFIGTNAQGTAVLSNGSDGVSLAASNNLVGGAATGARNIISGNTGAGISVFSVSGNLIKGNYIGTDVTGTLALGNLMDGIDLVDAPGNTIGGVTAGARNLISGNARNGVRIFGLAAGNIIQGNFIGTKASGTTALGNRGQGVLIYNFANDNRIGGTVSGAGNTIAFNRGDGVFVQSGVGNAILGNALFSNGGLGIDLAPNGRTANDPGDGDAGANNGQNFPVLTSAVTGSTATTVRGRLNSTASTTFTIELFSNAVCDASGNGEGRSYLKRQTVTTDANGNASFTATLSPVVPAGRLITATATDPGNNTSEFSACRVVQ